MPSGWSNTHRGIAPGSCVDEINSCKQPTTKNEGYPPELQQASSKRLTLSENNQNLPDKEEFCLKTASQKSRLSFRPALQTSDLPAPTIVGANSLK